MAVHTIDLRESSRLEPMALPFVGFKGRKWLEQPVLQSVDLNGRR